MRDVLTQRAFLLIALRLWPSAAALTIGDRLTASEESTFPAPRMTARPSMAASTADDWDIAVEAGML
jgi:hypothetical protein